MWKTKIDTRDALDKGFEAVIKYPNGKDLTPYYNVAREEISNTISYLGSHHPDFPKEMLLDLIKGAAERLRRALEKSDAYWDCGQRKARRTVEGD